MPELNNELREIYLEPGELRIAREPAIILTALGACIGITFWSAKLRVGALAHPLLRPDGFDCRKAPRHLTARRGFLDSTTRLAVRPARRLAPGSPREGVWRR